MHPLIFIYMKYWLVEKLFPCLYKLIFRIDCPICGFQRALLLALRGNFKASFKMYPPLIPCLVLILFASFYCIDSTLLNKKLLNQVATFVLLCIIVNYLVKIAFLITA